MKQLTLLMIAFCFVFQLNGQEETSRQNKIIIGGALSFFTQSNSRPITIGPNTMTRDTRRTTFSFTPYAGLALNEHWTIGLHLRYIFSKSKSTNDFITNPSGFVTNELINNQIGAGLFGRYIINPKNKINVFVQSALLFNIGKEENFRDFVSNNVINSNLIEARIDGGVFYTISSKLRALIRFGVISYNYQSSKIEDTGQKFTTNTFSSAFNLANLSFGLELTL